MVGGREAQPPGRPITGPLTAASLQPFTLKIFQLHVACVGLVDVCLVNSLTNQTRVSFIFASEIIKTVFIFE